MRQQLVETAQRIPSGNGGDGGVTAFRQRWRTILWRVSRRFFWLDRARIEDALADAILHHLAQDGSDVGGARKEKGELWLSSLYGEVCRNVGDSVRADRRRCRREREYARRKKNWSNEDFFVPSGFSAANTSIEEQLHKLEKVLEGCSTWEQMFVALRQQGSRDVTAYAAVLGVAQCSLEEQRRVVNLAWNRLRKKMQRLGGRRAQDLHGAPKCGDDGVKEEGGKVPQ